LYFFLADRKGSVYGARWLECKVVEGKVVEGKFIEGKFVKSAGVWMVLYKVDDGVSGKSQADK
jgi:hypothetical protein